MIIYCFIKQNQCQYKQLNMQEVTKSNNQQTMNYSPATVVQPEIYNQWYSNLNEDQRMYYYSPQQYYQWYYYQYYQNQYTINPININLQHNININNLKPKKQKLSRNQKRKMKKKQLQQEYEQEQKKMGKWVDLQRKDLVDGLKKIQQKEQRIKLKRKQKLSYLIQIHKEVYKHMVKKNKGKINEHREKVGNFRRKKKKLSHIKQMKQIYEKYKKGQIPKTINIIENKPKQQVKKQNSDHDSDFVTDSEESESEEQQGLKIKPKLESKEQQNKLEEKKQLKLSKNEQIKQILTIQYKTIGKLNGYVYNGITLREWVDHVPSVKLQEIVLKFVNRLAYKQAIKKVNQPQKARKLVIAGLHECRRTLWTKLDKKKSKLIVIALNIERNNLQRGTDDQLQQLLTYAHEEKVPVIHISTRSKLGRAYTGKFGPRITVISVINYEGYEDNMQAIMQQWVQMKKNYQNTNLNCFNF